MPKDQRFDGLELGFDTPALPGMAEGDIQTPCLILDLDALERNLRKMAEFARSSRMALRVHCKMHKSVDVAKLQMEIGGAHGVCCQKVSEAEVFARAGIPDILLTNEITDPVKIDRLTKLPRFGAKIGVCVDGLANVADLARAAERNGTLIDVYIEVDCGAGRCGVTAHSDVLALAKAIDASVGLHFKGLQAYHGNAQHFHTFEERKSAIQQARRQVHAIKDALCEIGLPPEVISGGGTGSHMLESASGLWTELQCGSYAFMDASYGATLDAEGKRLDSGAWENALFLLTSVMSHAKPGKAVCDAGLKVQSVDSGLPFIFGRNDVRFVKCSDEHGEIEDPENRLQINEKLRLVPGHCDPTCNIHDWYVGIRNGKVEVLWPVSARGKAY